MNQTLQSCTLRPCNDKAKEPPCYLCSFILGPERSALSLPSNCVIYTGNMFIYVIIQEAYHGSIGIHKVRGISSNTGVHITF